MRVAIRSSWPGAGCTPSEESSSSLTNVSQSATTAFGYCDTSPWMWMFTPGMFSSGPCVVCHTTSGMCFSASSIVAPFARNAAGSASFVPSSITTTSGRAAAWASAGAIAELVPRPMIASNPIDQPGSAARIHGSAPSAMESPITNAVGGSLAPSRGSRSHRSTVSPRAT